MENQNTQTNFKNHPPTMGKPFQMLPSHWCLVFMGFILILFIPLAGLNIYNWHLAVKLIFAILEIVGIIAFIICKVGLDLDYIKELKI